MSAAVSTPASAHTHELFREAKDYEPSGFARRTEFISQSLRRLTRRYGLRSRTAEALLLLIGYNDGTLRRNDAIAEDFIGYLSVRYDISPLEVVHRIECLVDS